ncbi:MAG TPA: adenylate/guanylate cyclase domain-containing protein [Gaiellaceae bacterium]|nr:adenylate/guanylate cyclase domain-containing protein [Gaiellaceae bacterium]
MALPTGTVTFLFTDIEGSTRLLDELGDEYAGLLAEHHRLMRQSFEPRGGVEVDTAGDAFFVAFERASDAVAAAAAVQEALGPTGLKVRMGIHTGQPLVAETGYVGMDVHQGARVMSAGHGGQVLVSDATHGYLDGSVSLTDLGLHRLKDLTEPQRLWQLGDAEFPPLRTLYQTNLPVQPTPLVGRGRELGEVLALLGRERLVTLTGAGGSGKTRLALQAAAELTDDFRDGVWWVSLAALRDPDLVEPTIAHAVGAKEDLADHLRTKRTLLLLDNFEHLLDAAALVSSILAEAPDLRVLATSRERLGLSGEHEYPVPTMVVDEAIALFTTRARQLRSAFEPDDTVGQICRRLDGLPLAIELAAARVKLLPPDQILDRLGRSLDLLAAGMRDAPERHQTLRATIAWSYELLSEEERPVFACVSVFAGSFSAEAAEAVCGADLRTLGALVDKSLVRQTDDGRLFVLETIREYAAERLREGGADDLVRRKHAEYFRDLAESLDLAVEAYERGARPRYDVALLEQQNFRAALDWAAAEDPVLGLRLAVAVEQFWVSEGPDEGARRFETLLAGMTDVPVALHARALRCHGGSLTLAGRFEEAKPLYEESLVLFEGLDDEWGAVHMRHRLASNAVSRGEWERSRDLLEENLVRARALGSSYLEGEALSVLGLVEDHDGNTERAFDLVRQSRQLARDAGFDWREAIDLHNLAELALKLGRVNDAEGYVSAALELSRAMNDRQTTVLALAMFARVACERGDAARAGRLWGAIEAEAARATLGRWGLDLDDLAASLRPVAGPVFERARSVGGQDSLEEAAEFAASVHSDA